MDWDGLLRLAQSLSSGAGASATTGCCGTKPAEEAESPRPPIARLFAAFREVRGGGGVRSKFVGEHSLHIDFLEYDIDAEAVRAAEGDLRRLAGAFAQQPNRVLDLVVALQAGRLADAYAHMDALGISEPALKAARGAAIGLLVVVLIAVALLVRSDTPIPETPIEKQLEEKKQKGTVEVTEEEKKAMADLGLIK